MKRQDRLSHEADHLYFVRHNLRRLLTLYHALADMSDIIVGSRVMDSLLRLLLRRVAATSPVRSIRPAQAFDLEKQRAAAHSFPPPGTGGQMQHAPTGGRAAFVPERTALLAVL